MCVMHTCIYIYVCMYVYIYIYIYVCVCVCVCVCVMYICRRLVTCRSSKLITEPSPCCDQSRPPVFGVIVRS